MERVWWPYHYDDWASAKSHVLMPVLAFIRLLQIMCLQPETVTWIHRIYSNTCQLRRCCAWAGVTSRDSLNTLVYMNTRIWVSIVIIIIIIIIMCFDDVVDDGCTKSPLYFLSAFVISLPIRLLLNGYETNGIFLLDWITF